MFRITDGEWISHGKLSGCFFLGFWVLMASVCVYIGSNNVILPSLMSCRVGLLEVNLAGDDMLTFITNLNALCLSLLIHYDDVIMTMLESQITSLTVVYSIVYSGVHQRKHQSSASLAFVREIHRGPVNFPHKWPVTRKMFPFDDVIMLTNTLVRTVHVFSTNVSWGSFTAHWNATLQWHHISVMVSLLIDMFSQYLKTKVTWKPHITGHLWGESTGHRLRGNRRSSVDCFH